jgi:hypothetical protein
MRRAISLLFVLAVFTFANGAPALDDQAQAEVVLKRGFKALGCANIPDKCNGIAATYQLKDKDAGVLTLVVQAERANRMRLTLLGLDGVGGPKARTIIYFDEVIDGDRGWLSFLGFTSDLSKDDLKNNRALHFGAWGTLLLHSKEDGITPSALGDAKVGDSPAAVIQMKARGLPDLRLYFDKESGLPIKREVRRADAFDTVTVHLFEKYADLEGVKYPQKITVLVNGKSDSEWEATEFKFVERFDDKIFAKPDKRSP